MAYVDGFLIAIPTANKEIYRQFADKAADLFLEFGATRVYENWGNDVPAGTVTDFSRAVLAKPDETVVFSWVEYPDKATRDAAGQKMSTDPRMKELGEMPFDGQRMLYGGFETILAR